MKKKKKLKYKNVFELKKFWWQKICDDKKVVMKGTTFNVKKSWKWKNMGKEKKHQITIKLKTQIVKKKIKISNCNKTKKKMLQTKKNKFW